MLIFNLRFFQRYVDDMTLLVYPKYSCLFMATLEQIMLDSFPLKIAAIKLCSSLICCRGRLSEKVNHFNLHGVNCN